MTNHAADGLTHQPRSTVIGSCETSAPNRTGG